MADRTKQILDILERAIWSAVQAIGGIYIAKGTVSVSAAETAVLTALTAALAAVKTLVLNALGDPKKGPKEWIEDLAARTAFTFGETLLAALLTAAATNLNLSSVQAAAIAGATAALAFVKAALAKNFGDPNSAATLSENATLVPAAA